MASRARFAPHAHGCQRALLDGLPPEWLPLFYSAAFALVAFVVGFAYFRRARDDFESAL